MKFILVGLLLLIHMIGVLHSTCVFESTFGFTLDCNFRKSSLFRVRNLGGVKAHIGLGLSVGDELGFAESLTNVEDNKKRSVTNTDALIATNSIGTLPASKLPAPAVAEKRSASPMFPYNLYNTNQNVVAIPSTTRAPIFYKRNTPQAMTEAQSLPLGVPAFKPLKPSLTTNIQSMIRRTTEIPATRKDALHQYPAPNLSAANLTFIQSQLAQNPSRNHKTPPMVISPQANAFKVPAFQALPSSVSRISTGQIVHTDDIRNPAANNGLNLEQYTTIPRVDSINRKDDHLDFLNQKVTSTQPTLPQIDLKGHTIEELAAVANVSVSAIKKAIELRQKQLLAVQEEIKRNKTMEQELKRDEMIAKQLAMYQQEHQKFLATSTIEAPTTASTTTSTTKKPTRATPSPKIVGKVSPHVIQSKVMNAPKEYYPVGYEKNFDDNFQTKVDLPPTTFHCGDQKHFPGLYADVDLGCMVFHVCALTDDGLIMKSFLCPESTLFDQTILKCNWWFYVDCKSSKTLYDSNLPVSKSYQLMKALTFFSNFKNKSSNDTDIAADISAIQNSVLTRRNGKKIDAKPEKVNKAIEKQQIKVTDKPGKATTEKPSKTTERPTKATERTTKATEMPTKSTEKTKTQMID